MVTTCRIGRLTSLAALVVLALPVAARPDDGMKGFGAYRPEDDSVELFQAIESGQLEVRLIPRDSAQVRLLVENKSGKPLNVRMPAAMGASPVLAQFQDLPGFNDGAMDNAPQQLGFGLPGMQNQGGNAGPFFNLGGQIPQHGRGIGLFNLAPETVGQMKLASVCLDHGRPNPRPTIRYELRRIEEVTDVAEVQEICIMLAGGQIAQKAAQAAAWHLNNGRNWEELEKERIHAVFGPQSKLRFTAEEIQQARRAVEKLQQRGRASGRSIAGSPGGL